jgi:hypothetical protein
MSKNTNNTTNTQNTTTNTKNSTMSTLKRARHLNFYNEDTRCTESILIVAESEKAYKTSDNKVVKKADLEKKQVLKNTIDYRYNTTEEDEKFTKIQEKLCKILEIDKNSDIRAFAKIFNVRETKRYYNILASDSVILNRASSIELLLTDSDARKLKDYECVVVEETETKLEKYAKNSRAIRFSLVLKTKEDIHKVAKLLA